MLQEDISRNAAWRAELRKQRSAKERGEITRAHMPEEDAKLRSRSNVEVNKGFSAEQAAVESLRCLDCVDPKCVQGCPVNIDIPRFIKYVEAGKILDAAKAIRESSSLPAVCGRVCPQELQCEAQCIYVQKMNKPAVAIGNLERYVADYEQAYGTFVMPDVKPNGRKVAAVGSGPASLAFASDMALLGYSVTVFEALHEIGGVLKYGIPEFRLPNSVVEKEIDTLKRMGIQFETNVVVGRTISFNELEEAGFEGIFVGSGAGLPRFMNIPGENLAGVMSANEYLTRINLMGASRPGYDTPVLKGKNVAIVGGGNTAMDAVRTALRQGADRAMIVYRRSLEEMPARLEEIKHAQEEGVEFLMLHNPTKYTADATGRVCEMSVQRMELGEPDASGRRSPVVMKGSDYTIPVDLVVVSIGVSPNPLISQSAPELKTTKWGTLEVDKETMQTTKPIIFAGGDIVRGGATVILAMGDGRRAAKAMDKHIQGGN